MISDGRPQSSGLGNSGNGQGDVLKQIFKDIVDAANSGKVKIYVARRAPGMLCSILIGSRGPSNRHGWHSYYPSE
jgi:hypothetical protein